ncbi:MAG TPA: porin, partial [Chromatiales bacterium]|nr:porin [Chromatiales bacterium]
MKQKVTAVACAIGMAISASAFADTEADVKNLQAEVEQLKQDVKDAKEWKDPTTLVHFAGYASVGFFDTAKDTNDSNGKPTFAVGNFSPIFHFMYSDFLMLEAELELQVDAEGSTEVALEYLSIDLFLNDYMALVAGKFLSPLGQFRQNLHPSWINKMATAPAGFGHDQAAPNAEIGVMLRGGVPMGAGTGNYAVYVGNGPALEPNTIGNEIEGIETPGLNSNIDGQMVGGGRLGWFNPAWKFEFGLSGATGKAAIIGDASDPSRDYRVTGADFVWRPGSFEVRGEYIKQDIGDQPGSVAPEGGIWQAWYIQVAYRFPQSAWEPVLRYGEY